MAEPPGEIGVENQGPWGRHGIVGTSGTNRSNRPGRGYKKRGLGAKVPIFWKFSPFSIDPDSPD